MKKGDTVYISSLHGVEEGVVTVARLWPNVRVDGVVRKQLSPTIIHATREEAETAVLGAKASAAESVVQSRAYDTKCARGSRDQTRFALERAEANLVAKEAAEAEAVAKLQTALDALAARTFGEGVTLRALGAEPSPDGAELVRLSERRLRPVTLSGRYNDTYIVVRP